MKVGIIASAGGAAFHSMAAIAANADIEFVLVTDRQCGAEKFPNTLNIKSFRVEDTDRRGFSVKAADIFNQADVAGVLMFFSRMVSKDLYEETPVFNIHPATLPAFPGLNAVVQARRAGVRILGSTLHHVDETLDGGQIIAQIASPVSPEETEARWNKISYLQKVYLGLVWLEVLAGEKYPSRLNASHGIRTRWAESFKNLQSFENTVII